MFVIRYNKYWSGDIRQFHVNPGVLYQASRQCLFCLSLLVCGYGSPCDAVAMLRYDPKFDAKLFLATYERVERDKNVAGPLTIRCCASVCRCILVVV